MRGRGWWPAVVLALLVGASAFPFYWAILSSFTPESRLFQEPSLLPSHLVLDGIGPKQSRNLLQWIGVSKYEIPVDSRITKWLNQNLLKYHLTANLLADHTYYDLVSDGIQLLCKRTHLYPCLLDAAIFTSFDGGWSESDIGTSESLENA